MAESAAFRIRVGGGDWGSPVSNEATYPTLEEATAAAREYIDRQRQEGAGLPLRVTIEETRLDGSIAEHSVD